MARKTKPAETEAGQTEPKDDVPGTDDEPATPKVTWDDSNMQSVFANVVNGSSTREEVTLFFGTNQTWNLTDFKELKVQLSNRVILTPYAAKRLWVLLGGILQAYERRFGELNIDAPSRQE